MLVSWLGLLEGLSPTAFCQLQPLRVVTGLHQAVVVAFALSELRVTRPPIIHQGSEQVSLKVLDMAQYTSQRQDPSSSALCGRLEEWAGKEIPRNTVFKFWYIDLTVPTVFWPLLVTFGHILAGSKQIILPVETKL